MYLFKVVCSICLFFAFHTPLDGSETLHLIDNLRKAQPGDFIVSAQNKNYSVLHIWSKNQNTMAIEEISISAAKVPRKNFSWRAWVAQGAPHNSSWIIYVIDLQNGQPLETYALTRQGWVPVSHRENMLSTLFHLQLASIPLPQRKRVGAGLPFTPRQQRALWQPTLVFDGNTIEGIHFDGWKTQWPKDGSELSGMMIEAYLPEAGSGYPSYFPYWLQISGAIGCAKIRIVDTGTKLNSPAAPPIRGVPLTQGNDKQCAHTL